MKGAANKKGYEGTFGNVDPSSADTTGTAGS
jgi:hypothetical protein